MKRSLAIVLSVLMVLSCCTALLSFVAFADAPAFDWATVWFSPDENGIWQTSAEVPADELFDYDYTAAIVGSDLKIGVVIKDVTVSGTDASFGNGNGTNFRIWLRAPEGEFDSYNYFFDISKKTSSWDAQMKYNKSTDGNSGGTVFAYGGTLTGFSYDVAVLDGNDGKNNVALDVTFPLSLFTNATETGEIYCADTPTAVDVVVSVSNKAVSNYCLHSNNNTASPVSKAVFDANGKLVAAADVSYVDGFSAGEPIVIDSAENSCYPNGQIPSDNDYYKFTYNVYDGKLYIDLSIHTVLATKDAASFGNGNGSNIRIWLYDPAKSATEAFNSYNYFLDVEYHADGTFTDRLMYNQKGTKSNNAAALYDRDAADKPYTVINTVNTAAEDGYTWNAKIIFPLDVIATAPDYEFQFQPNIGFWGEHPNDPAKVETGGATVVGFSSRTYGHTVDPYNAWAKDSALPYFGNPGFFTDKAVPTEGNIYTENLALGCDTEYLFNTKTTSYLGSLTDGFLPTKSYSSTDPQGNKAWRTFPARTVTGADPVAEAVINLGAEYNNIASIRAYVCQLNNSGIHIPDGIKAYASNDGETWIEVGDFDCSGLVTTSGSEPAWVYLNFDKYLDARYIKISVDNGSAAGFSFLGEVEVNTAELAETVYIKDINSYSWDAETDARQYGPILAFGDKKTAAQMIGGEWFGWWTYVRATWDIDKGAFIVKSLHRASAGQGSEYNTEVMGPYDIVLLTSTAAGAASYSYGISHYIMDNVEIGDKLYLYGLETLSASVKGQLTIGEGGVITSPYAVTFKSPLLGEDYLYIVDDPAGKTDVDTPYLHTSENLALNKTVTYNASLSSYVGDITDGVKPATGYDGKVWRGLYADTPGNFVIDLGEKYENIGSVNVYHWPTKASGITPADYMKVSVSNDGINYTEVGELDMAQFKGGASGAFNTSVEFDKLVAGRYVKIDFAGHWVFFGEVEVFGYEAIPGAQLLSSYYYGVGEKAILATWLMGDKIDDLNPNLKTHAWWNFASAAWDFEKGAFVVNEVVTGDGSTSDFGDFAIPDFGVVIGAHQTAQAATAQFIAGLKAGDTLYFTENADITNLNAVGIDLDNVWVSTDELGNAYTLAEKYPILTNAGFAGGDISILVPFGENNTFGKILAALRGGSADGSDNDYNYYTAFVVDANGKIIAKYLKLGRPDGAKNAVEIPEGGFAIAYNGGSSIVTNAKLGDTVILNGTTLEAIAANEADFAAAFALDDTLVWNDTLTGVSYSKYHAHEYIDKVVAPTCTVDGYTEHKCLCGKELDHTGIVPAAGHPSLEGVEIQTHPSTCVEHGYTYKVCPACNEEVVIEPDLPLIDHDYVETAIGPFVKHVCSVCGDYYYTDAKGNTEGIKDIKISHFISFNWNTFEAMIIPGDGAKKPNEIQTSANFSLGSYKAYLLEATDVAGVYYASAFTDNAATYKDTTLAVGQYLLLFSGNNDMYSFASTGALKGWYFADHNAELATSTNYAIDTGSYEPRHMYAMFVSADYTEYNAAVEAAGNLVETDWTAESWANLQTALATDVSGRTLLQQEEVDAATNAILTAMNNLVKAAADIVLGDFDGDKEFTSDDLIYACQLDADLITATEAQLAALDVDGDGDFDSDDLIYMCQYDAGVIDVWPVNAEPVE